jgi:hypothetical protein
MGGDCRFVDLSHKLLKFFSSLLNLPTGKRIVKLSLKLGSKAFLNSLFSISILYLIVSLVGAYKVAKLICVRNTELIDLIDRLKETKFRRKFIVDVVKFLELHLMDLIVVVLNLLLTAKDLFFHFLPFFRSFNNKSFAYSFIKFLLQLGRLFLSNLLTCLKIALLEISLCGSNEISSSLLTGNVFFREFVHSALVACFSRELVIDRVEVVADLLNPLSSKFSGGLLLTGYISLNLILELLSALFICFLYRVNLFLVFGL